MSAAWGRALAVALLLATVAFPAYPAEPFVTDDARIIERGTCKLEAGRRTQPQGHKMWLLPACNLFLNMETEFAHVDDFRDEEQRTSANALQFKGLWRDIPTHGYGVGWVVRTEALRHPQPGERRVNEHAALLLASFPLFKGVLTLHANAGGRWDAQEDRALATGGVLAEVQLHRQVAVLAEIYGTSRQRRGLQAGVRLTLIPDHIDLSITRGGDDADVNGRRYWAVSIELTTPKPAR